MLNGRKQICSSIILLCELKRLKLILKAYFITHLLYFFMHCYGLNSDIHSRSVLCQYDLILLYYYYYYYCLNVSFAHHVCIYLIKIQ